MVDRYGRWIAALIMAALLMAVVILFATVDLDLNTHTTTDVRSAPIFSGADATATQDFLLTSPEATATETPAAGDQGR
jgi:hypothetical protein